MFKKAIREAIVDIAREIFARYGYRKTTMDTIARAARKGKSSVYYYFKNKEELMQAVLDKEIAGLKREIANAMALATDPQEKFHTYVLTRMRIFGRIARSFSTFKYEYLEEYNIIQRLRENYDKYEMKFIRDILEEGLKKGVFSMADPQMTAFAIVVALKGFEYMWATEEDLEKIEKKILSLTDILFNGILKR
jgi:AcrR family transcriptional regulator